MTLTHHKRIATAIFAAVLAVCSPAIAEESTPAVGMGDVGSVGVNQTSGTSNDNSEGGNAGSTTNAGTTNTNGASTTNAGISTTTPATSQPVFTVEDGMFGFFQSVGATDALHVLTDSSYSSFTQKGNPDDATSLRNVLATFPFLRECNKLREANGLNELKVSDRLMAIAESNANWSDTTVAHSGQFNVGENLAWGYTDPFEGWYVEEKALYERTGNKNRAGHYLNIIDASYETTGFAICTKRTVFNTTFGQVFSYAAQSGEQLYTVDAYEARFLQYYGSLQVSMLRVYNPWSGEHHYTNSASERDGLVSLGWIDEGIGWVSPAYSKTPVYRLYNPWSGDHHYTTSKDEYDKLGEMGWKQEGLGWYSDNAKSTPLYRLFNPYVTIGTHHYTTSASERDAMVKAGWVDEGIGWYGVK